MSKRDDDSQTDIEVGMTTAERRQLVQGWNDTERPVPGVTLAGLFEAQVARSPEASAVVCGDTVLSYAELDAAASRLASAASRPSRPPACSNLLQASVTGS